MGSKQYRDYLEEAELEYHEDDERWEKETGRPRTWRCCGGIDLYVNEKCPVCGDKY